MSNQDTELESTAPAAVTGIEALVCGDIAARQQHGIRKYGTTVAGNPLPLGAWLQHAYEEALDLAVYLRRSLEEMRARGMEGAATAFSGREAPWPLTPPPQSIKELLAAQTEEIKRLRGQVVDLEEARTKGGA